MPSALTPVDPGSITHAARHHFIANHHVAGLAALLLAGTVPATSVYAADFPEHLPKEGALLAKFPPDVMVKQWAAEAHCAHPDLTARCPECIKSSNLHPHLCYRDVVHVNEYGGQILSQMLMACMQP